MLTCLFKPLRTSLFSHLTYSQDQIQSRKSLSKCSHGISQDLLCSSHLLQGHLAFPSRWTFPWLPFRLAPFSKVGGLSLELRGWAAQTASKSLLWKCVTSYSCSLLEGFCCHSWAPRFPSHVHPPLPASFARTRAPEVSATSNRPHQPTIIKIIKIEFYLL